MKNDKNWMLMTYYCPTHGDLGRIETLEIQRKAISKNYLKKSQYTKTTEN